MAQIQEQRSHHYCWRCEEIKTIRRPIITVLQMGFLQIPWELLKTASTAEKLADHMIQNPHVLTALQKWLDIVSHTPSSSIKTLPKAGEKSQCADTSSSKVCSHRSQVLWWGPWYEEQVRTPVPASPWQEKGICHCWCCADRCRIGMLRRSNCLEMWKIK